MKKLVLSLLVAMLLVGLVGAQDSSESPYPEEIMALIQQAKETNATELMLRDYNHRLENTGIPPELWTLTQLRKLNLSGWGDMSNISALPPEIGNLVNLEELYLGGNSSLRLLPPEIGNLRNLRYLDLSMTGIQDFPIEILNLTNLEYLDFQYHGRVPEIVFQLTSLKRLEIGANGLTSLSPEIGNLVNLQVLSLNSNELESLPPEIGQLRSLQALYLGNSQFGTNRLLSLPPEIGELQQLRVLDLRFNQLESLPPEIGLLANLCYLDLRGNQLRELPPEFGRLSQLGLSPVDNVNNICFVNGGQPRLDISLNSSLALPEEVLAQGTPAILEYLRNEAWWHLQKLIVSGASAVGVVTLLILGWRWKNRRGKAKRKQKF